MRPVVALRITPPQAAVGQEEQDYRLAPTPCQRAQQAFQPSWLPTPWSTKDLCLHDIKDTLVPPQLLVAWATELLPPLFHLGAYS